MTPLVALERVSRTFGAGTAEEVHALVEVDLELCAGSLVVVAGPSGSGKSTLLNVVAGWERPDVGRVTVAGSQRPGHLPWDGLAVVPQSLGLLDDLTLRENAELPARLAGVANDLEPLLTAFALVEPADRLPRQTSLGQQQRAALARALALRPALLVADEPTAHQDRDSAHRVLAALRSAATRDGALVLVATHDPDASRYADRLLRVTAGRLDAVDLRPGG